MKTVLQLTMLLLTALADGPGVIFSIHSARDFPLTADPASAHWKNVPAVVAENDQRGKLTPGHRTEIRSRWTDKNLYFLFVCPYEQLYLRPEMSTTTETNKLWEWDVAEVFVGADFEQIWRYREFQVSPRGEWVDLDIDRKSPKPEAGWTWNSGFKVMARLDENNKVWYGEMQIPIPSIDARPPKEGSEMRINFYRIQGPAPRKHIAWQPTNSNTYHVPEAFGRLRLVKQAK